MRKISTYVASIVAVGALAAVARGDIVHLKNGRSIQGTIEEETATKVILKTETGTVTLAKTQIASIEKEEPKPAEPQEAASVTTGSVAVGNTPSVRDIVRLLRAEKFADAERALEAVRAPGRDPQSDVTRLTLAVERLRDMKSLRPLLDKWCAGAPRSYMAHLVRGDSYVAFAWEARGGGWATTVTDDGWKLFRERLTVAKSDLELAARLEPRDPHAPARLVTVGRGLDLTEEQIDEYVRQAVKADPRCYQIYLTRIWSLLPRWGGTNDLMFAFARKSAQDHPDDPAIAMTIVAAHADYAEYTAGQMGQARDQARAYLNRQDVKKEIDDIVDRVLAKYPRAGWACCLRANVAKIAGDTEGRLKWLRRAAELDHATSANDLGMIYQSGQGVKKDDAEAVKWFTRAAELGHPAAQFSLGWCTQTGTGIAKDPKRAIALYRESAELDNPDGALNLASCYQTGTGVTKDDAEFLRLLQRAADLGAPSALYALGYYCYKGQGFPQDKAKGRKLLEAAAARGSQEAKAMLATLKD